jgi:hypothetical protein
MERYATGRKSPRTYRALGERRLGRGLMMPATTPVLRKMPGFECKTVLRYEAAAFRIALQYPPVLLSAESEAVPALFHCDTVGERYGITKGVPESDIDEPRLVQIYSKRHVIERDSKAAFFLGYLGGQQSNRVAEFIEKPRERRIELIAEAPATVRDDLSQDPTLVEDDLDTVMDIQVLEGNFLDMTFMKKCQQVQGRSSDLGNFQTLQISINFHEIRQLAR